MIHDSTKQMLFNFLSGRDYNKNSNELNFDMGYDLGDYSAEDRRFYQLARDCAHLLRARLCGVFDDNGNIKSLNPQDEWHHPNKEYSQTT